MARKRQDDSGAGSRVADRLHEFEALCHARGLPVTMQRQTILEVVLECSEHPSADEVYDRVKDRVPNVSRSTVYRALEAMVELGVVRRLNHAGVGVRYDGKVQRHHHLVCTTCNRVLDYQDPSLDDLPVPKSGVSGFRITDYSLHFTGICAECSKRRRG
jgi:Fur family peroxide stress response transcriptional regulator